MSAWDGEFIGRLKTTITSTRVTRQSGTKKQTGWKFQTQWFKVTQKQSRTWVEFPTVFLCGILHWADVPGWPAVSKLRCYQVLFTVTAAKAPFSLLSASCLTLFQKIPKVLSFCEFMALICDRQSLPVKLLRPQFSFMCSYLMCFRFLFVIVPFHPTVLPFYLFVPEEPIVLIFSPHPPVHPCQINFFIHIHFLVAPLKHLQ